MTRLVLLAACAFTCAALVSPPESADDVDTLIQAGLAKHAIPGAALAIGQKGIVTKSAGYGTAGAAAMTADTPLYIGSQSKSFTALAILQLAEDGKLSLDDPVRAHLPSFQIADEAASARITLRHLLNHTSGMSEQGYIEYLPESASLDDQVRDLSRAALTAPVGTRMAYFNPGYAVLGRVIEAVSGRSYGDFLRERIFLPLRMSRTFTDRAEAERAGLATGYTQMFGIPLPLAQTHRTYGVPEGYIMSTANDMLRYVMALNNGGELDGARILSEQGVQTLFNPSRVGGSNYALGWMIDRFYDEPAILHGGANERFFTSVMLLPGRGLSVVLLFNQDHLMKAYLDYPPIFYGLLRALTGRPAEPEGISSRVYGWGIGLAFVGICLLTGRGLWRIGAWRRAARAWPTGRRLRAALPHLAAIVVTALLVMVVVPGLLQRGPSLVWFVGFLPDVALLTAVAITGDAILGSVKALSALRPRRRA